MSLTCQMEIGYSNTQLSWPNSIWDLREKSGIYLFGRNFISHSTTLENDSKVPIKALRIDRYPMTQQFHF